MKKRDDEADFAPIERSVLFEADCGLESTGELRLGGSLRRVLDAFPFYVMLVDADHRIVMANSHLMKSVGLKNGEEMGRLCPELVHGKSGDYPGCPLPEAVRTGRTAEVELLDESSGRWIASSVFPTGYVTDEGRKVYLHLARDITRKKTIEADNLRRLNSEAALAEVLRISLSGEPVERQLQGVLERVLSIPWLSILAKGCIFLSDESTGLLSMKAQVNLSPELLTSCAEIEPGFCLCGRAAASAQCVFADCVDERHDMTYPGMAPHGHYCLPVQVSEKVLGVLNLYVEAGHARDSDDEMFLRSVADVLAGAIERARARASVAVHMTQLSRALEGTVTAIGGMLEVRDPYTAGHQARVAELAVAIGEELALEAPRIEALRLAASIHDIGKIAVPAEILSKPGRLSELEFGMIKVHPEVGYGVLKDIEFPWPIADIVRQHHERIDGTGYPQGLHGSEILLESRVLCVADVIEAVASHRPYRPSLGTDKALRIVQEGRGSFFDEDAVDAALRVFEQGYTL
jgi:HD-GYP domain-containing protein (c-di-GMP phosphodiesterase class II)